MTIEELHATVVDGFRRVDERFAANDERFARIDEQFGELRQEIRQEIHEGMREFRGAIEVRLREQEEAIRRHFDVMVEKVEAAVRVVAEGHGHLRTVADNHEGRLQAIEKRM